MVASRPAEEVVWDPVAMRGCGAEQPGEARWLALRGLAGGGRERSLRGGAGRLLAPGVGRRALRGKTPRSGLALFWRPAVFACGDEDGSAVVLECGAEVGVRWVILTDDFPPCSGGVAVWTAAVADGLARRGEGYSSAGTASTSRYRAG